jgi:hypothetical protein
MLNVVFAVAIVGVALLAAAVLTDNTIVALVVIAVAVVGLVLLVRDWLGDRGQDEPQQAVTGETDTGDDEEPHLSHEEGLEPDEFEPDVPYGDDADDERET